jgi:DNA repair exonuclease SbcCD ATPase subunit
MGLFSKKPTVDPAEVNELRAEMEALRVRLDASESAKEMLEAHVYALNDTTNALASRSHIVDSMTQRMAEMDVLKRQVAQLDVVNAKLTSLDSLNGKLADLAERVNLASVDAKQAKDQTVSLHERISNVSTELANQLGELSRELDVLGQQVPDASPPPAPVIVTEQLVTEDMIEQLHDAQVRLAAEQARYEIAFRQDLASLAEQVKRPRS